MHRPGGALRRCGSCMHHAGEFFEIAMSSSGGKTRGPVAVAAFMVCAIVAAWGQETSSPPLGDVARETRKELTSATHVPAKRVANGDDDGPDGGGVWRIRLCTIQPCHEFSITLPKNPKWIRAEQEPRPVLIPVSGHEGDAGRAIRVYAAQSIDLRYTLDVFKRTFLQSWFARPEYFGQGARLSLDEHIAIDWSSGTVTHFTITTPTLKYRGLSVVAATPYGNFGFACVYREENSAVCSSLCDA